MPIDERKGIIKENRNKNRNKSRKRIKKKDSIVLVVIKYTKMTKF